MNVELILPLLVMITMLVLLKIVAEKMVTVMDLMFLALTWTLVVPEVFVSKVLVSQDQLVEQLNAMMEMNVPSTTVTPMVSVPLPQEFAQHLPTHVKPSLVIESVVVFLKITQSHVLQLVLLISVLIISVLIESVLKYHQLVHVTITIHVPLINASQLLDNVFMNQMMTSSVTITTHVPTMSVALVFVLLHQRAVMMIMYVLLINVKEVSVLTLPMNSLATTLPDVLLVESAPTRDVFLLPSLTVQPPHTINVNLSLVTVLLVLVSSAKLPIASLHVMMVMTVLLVMFVLQMDAEELLSFAHLLLLNVKNLIVLLDNVYYVAIITYNATLKILLAVLLNVSMVLVYLTNLDTVTVPILISVPSIILVVPTDVPLLHTLVYYLHVSTLTVMMMVSAYSTET